MRVFITLYDSHGVEPARTWWVEVRSEPDGATMARQLYAQHVIEHLDSCALDRFTLSRSKRPDQLLRIVRAERIDGGPTKDLRSDAYKLAS